MNVNKEDFLSDGVYQVEDLKDDMRIYLEGLVDDFVDTYPTEELFDYLFNDVGQLNYGFARQFLIEYLANLDKKGPKT